MTHTINKQSTPRLTSYMDTYIRQAGVCIAYPFVLKIGRFLMKDKSKNASITICLSSDCFFDGTDV